MNWHEIDTVLLDLDGTLLDLQFDNYFWSELVPARFAHTHRVDLDTARREVGARIRARHGTLQWYCTDFWSEQLQLDIIALKREIRQRIGPRPGAQEFLAALQASGKTTHLVTNAHPDTLSVKLDEVPIGEYFDGTWTSHDFGHAKESVAFWEALHRVLPFDPERSLFIDDNESVLDAAAQFGIRHLRTILRPDGGLPERSHTRHPAIAQFADILPTQA